MERTRNGPTKLNRLRATRHPVSALRKEAAGPLSRDPEGRPHDLAPCTLEPWAELQRGRDGALAGRPPGPGAAPHAARHILVFSGLDRPVILERRLVSRQNECQSHRFLGPCSVCGLSPPRSCALESAARLPTREPRARVRRPHSVKSIASYFAETCETTPPLSLKSLHTLKCGVALCTSTAAASLYTYERERAR